MDTVQSNLMTLIWVTFQTKCSYLYDTSVKPHILDKTQTDTESGKWACKNTKRHLLLCKTLNKV